MPRACLVTNQPSPVASPRRVPAAVAVAEQVGQGGDAVGRVVVARPAEVGEAAGDRQAPGVVGGDPERVGGQLHGRREAGVEVHPVDVVDADRATGGRRGRGEQGRRRPRRWPGSGPGRAGRRRSGRRRPRPRTTRTRPGRRRRPGGRRPASRRRGRRPGRSRGRRSSAWCTARRRCGCRGRGWRSRRPCAPRGTRRRGGRRPPSVNGAMSSPERRALGRRRRGRPGRPARSRTAGRRGRGPAGRWPARPVRTRAGRRRPRGRGPGRPRPSSRGRPWARRARDDRMASAPAIEGDREGAGGDLGGGPVDQPLGGVAADRGHLADDVGPEAESVGQLGGRGRAHLGHDVDDGQPVDPVPQARARRPGPPRRPGPSGRPG